MKPMIDFSHIDENFSAEQRRELASYYRYYHRKVFMYKHAYRRYKRVQRLISMTLLTVTATDVISTRALANPMMLILSGLDWPYKR